MEKHLGVTVWSWFKDKVNHCHGGVKFPLCSNELTTVKRKWYKLKQSAVSVV